MEVGPLQGQRFPDPHPRAQQDKHHIVQVAGAPGATQFQAAAVASNAVLMQGRQRKQVASMLEREGVDARRRRGARRTSRIGLAVNAS